MLRKHGRQTEKHLTKLHIQIKPSVTSGHTYLGGGVGYDNDLI